MSTEQATDAQEERTKLLDRLARDTGYAPKTWAFDDEVTRVFDDMLERSIPDYETMRRLVTDLAVRFAQPKTDIVDLGCSRGDALGPIIEQRGAYNRYVGVEVSPPMLQAVRARFAKLIECSVVDIRDLDLRTHYPPVQASVTLAVLTLMFIPMERRFGVMRNMAQHTLPGGAAIVVEKVLGNTPETAELCIEQYHQLKERHGYTTDEVTRKALSLEGVLVPMTPHWLEEALVDAGFQRVECMWRWCNFGAWLALKGKEAQRG